MAILKQNAFTEFDLTPEEEIQGAILTTLQTQFIQNQVALSAQEALASEYNVNNPLDSVQREARSKGIIHAYQFLLDASIASQELMMQLKSPEQD